MAVSLNDKYDAKVRQQAVVEHGSGLLVVVAGPGTGKTDSLLRKIETLLDSGVDAKQIYYLTFVNSIVDAFKNDIRKPKEERGLGVDPDSLGIHVSTLHSLAFQIVKVYSDELGLPAHLEIIELSPKSQSPMSQIFVDDLFSYSKAAGIVTSKKTFDNLLKSRAEAWQKLTRPNAACAELSKLIELFFEKYEICSWDKLVPLAIKAIAQNGLPKWLQGAQHFLIDEYQDFNPAEQRLIKLITEPADSVVIVGDPDQSIYSGRSASPQGILDLLELDDAEYVNFVICRRCPKKVVGAANNLLRFMDPNGYEQKELKSLKKEDGVVDIAILKSCKAEIEQVSALIKDPKAPNLSEIVVLLPTKKAADFYSTKLMEFGVTCAERSTDLSVEIIEAVLRLVVLKAQPFLERLVLAQIPTINNKFNQSVLPLFMTKNLSVVSSLDLAHKDQKWQKRTEDSLEMFKATLDKLKSEGVDEVLNGILTLGITLDEAVIRTLSEIDGDISVRDRVKLALKVLRDDLTEEATIAESVQVLTIHSSKGLSKRVVIIPAFDDNLLPGDKEGEQLSETHRLVYVAVTRAKDQILIAFPRTRAKGDPLNYGPKPKLSRYAKILLP